MCFCGRNLME
jgi:hypothetical protein